MSIIEYAFVCLAVAVWASVYGYYIALRLVAAFRRSKRPGEITLPEIAIVIPTLDEALFIQAKLEDLARADYPAERLAFVVVDGGSTDGTLDVVRRRQSIDPRVRIIEVPGRLGKMHQINRAVSELPQEILVFTDADSRLEPACIRELVAFLLADPGTAIAGATIRPDTSLLEERVHWWLLNRLWWLEGEVFAAAGLSGVCYAARRSYIAPLPADAIAEDMHVAIGANADGAGVRTCRRAHAVELRVPRTMREWIDFRLRRGRVYLAELRRSERPGRAAAASFGTGLARSIRLWQICVLPWLCLALAIGSAAFAITQRWHYPFVTTAAFALSTLAIVIPSLVRSRRSRESIGLAFAALRFVFFAVYSLLRLNVSTPRAALSGGSP